MIALAYLSVGILLGLLFGMMKQPPGFIVAFLLANLLLLPALLGIFKLLTGVFDGKPLGSVGLAFCGGWIRELGIGLGLGAAMILLVAGLERLLGLANFVWSASSPGRLLLAGGLSCLLLFLAATNEELMFRGYPFQRLIDSLGPAGAVAVTSALFGLVHLGNPSPGWISTLNTMLVGLPLAVAYLRTRALWLPTGIHFAWNFFQGYGLGLPVSGIALPVTVLRAEVHGEAWLTGGNYGPEGGVLATGVIFASTVYLVFSKSIYMSEEMKTLVFGPTPSSEGLAEVVASPAGAAKASNVGRIDVN